MYAYTHDPQTGGLLLNNSTPPLSKEPRPVYYQELDILGLDQHWTYAKQSEYPYLWAESNSYWYRGQLVFKTKGGSLYTKPELEFSLDADGNRLMPDGSALQPVDIAAMVAKNRELLEVIEQFTIKKIYDVYQRYRKRMDIFHVAFSGGKDSIVLLDLVKRALPKSSFVVVFGDTGMEFPDTYDVIDKVEAQCRAEKIEFYRAASHFKPEESWKRFGPPSRVLRWCCSVHKSAPQTLKLREILGKNDYVGMAFVGVRAFESITRSEYDYENYGKKQKGQYSHNSILDWSSAEVWLYILAHNLIINEAYKKGNSRAGCLFCPMSGGKSDCFRRQCYPDEIQKYTDMIQEAVNENDIRDYESYLSNGGWESRSSGRDLNIGPSPYKEEVKGDILQITVSNPTPNWQEWLKTIGETPFEYKIERTKQGFEVKIPISADRTSYMKRIKNVFHKTAYCVGCRACEVNCSKGCISFKNGLQISDCIQCGQCLDIPYGCYVADSLKKPVEGKRMKSLNTFEEHAPKPEWVADFFYGQNTFLAENNLGPNQQTKFRRFLSDAALINKSSVTEFFSQIINMGSDTEQAWGLILTQLVNNNPQMRWYVENLNVGLRYPRKNVEDMLINVGQSEKMARAIISSFKRLCDLPLGTKLSFGTVTENGRQIDTLMREKSTLTDSRVVLYSLYRFAEACEGYYQFTLTRLLDHTIESAGISPTQIFGFDRDDMEQFLNGLSAKYPDFINVTFTHDLDKITLREDKASADVLTLF